MDFAKIEHLKFPTLVALASLLLGLVGDLLLYGKPMGISFPILMLALLIGLLALILVEGATLTWANLWLIIPLLFLAVMSAVRAAPSLRFLNVSGALLLLLLLANRLSGSPLANLNLGGYLGTMLETSAFSLSLPFPLLMRSAKELQGQSKGCWRPAIRVAVGLLIALPLLCVFTALFVSADLVFKNLVREAIESFSLPDLIGQSLLTSFLGWLIAGLFVYALTRHRGGAETEASTLEEAVANGEPNERAAGTSEGTGTAVQWTPRTWLGSLEASVVLFSIDALFLVFVVIQFATLFGGEAFLKSQGLTYSEYARRGFFELLTVSLIVLGLILVMDYISRRETTTQKLVFVFGCGLMIVMTIVILASAFFRMSLYEQAYGFTRLRLQTHVFMIWLALLLTFVLIILITNRVRLFATGALVFAIGVVGTLDVINQDAWIVQRNLERYRQGESLDVEYVGRLSADAVPSLMSLLYEYEPEIGAQAGPWLRRHLEQLDKRQERASWPSAHWGINRAYQALDTNRELIEQFELPAMGSFYD